MSFIKSNIKISSFIRNKYFFQFICLFYMCFFSFNANSACTSSLNHVNLPTSPSQNIPSNLAIGQVMFSTTVTIPRTQFATCASGQSDTANLSATSPGVLVSGYSDVYTYNGIFPSGVGIRFKENGSSINLTTGKSWSIGPGGGSQYYNQSVTFELVKTSNNFSGWNYGGFCFRISLNSTGRDAVDWCFTTTLNSVASTCNVSTPNVTIPLGSMPVSTFPSVGSMSPLSPNYNIQLSCAYGPKVSMAITGSTVSGNNNLFGILTGGATGVAVQLSRSGSIVTRGQSYVISASAPTGTLNIPIAARYVRTDTVTPGRANANMTATITYN